MAEVGTELLFLFVLLIANGVFAMSETAVISSRKARLKQRADAGDRNARAALRLADAPDRFLSTVQIGITLVGILAGAFGGATLSKLLAARLALVPALAPYSEAIALGVIVLLITYLSLVIGELVPKRLALNNPERVASFVARPMRLLSRLTAPVVTLLTVSTAGVLWLLRVERAEESPVTEDEIKVLIEQGTEAGVFHEAEQDLVESVFRLADRRASALMTPRSEIMWLDAAAPPEETARRIAETRHARYPVCDGSPDTVLGIVQAKDLLARTLAGEPLDLRRALLQSLYVPDTKPALQVLEEFKRAHLQIAFVIDEYGTVRGLLTEADVLEAIVGDLPAAIGGADDYAVRRDDGSWLLDGALPVDSFHDILPEMGRLPGAEAREYETIAGFVLLQLGRVPRAGDGFDYNGARFEVMDMDGKRIDKLLVVPPPPAPSSAETHD